MYIIGLLKLIGYIDFGYAIGYRLIGYRISKKIYK